MEPACILAMHTNSTASISLHPPVIAGVPTGEERSGLFVYPEMKTYAEKLKDPRWQRKRLEILNRDEFACRDCGNKRDTLHVHHCSYAHGREPWDYDDSNLRTLCETCHESRHGCERTAKDNFSFIMSSLTQNQIHRLTMEMLEAISVGGEPRAISSECLSSEQKKDLEELLSWL